MKRFITAVIGFTFFYLIYGLIISQSSISILPTVIEPQNAKGFYDYSGVINVHSTRSTGGGDFNKIVTSAQEVDLDFIFLTDLNVFDPALEAEGYYNKLLVFIDAEYSYLDSRLLNLDAETNSQLSGPGRAQMALTDLLSQEEKSFDKGLLVLAHPFKPGYSWSGEYPVGLDGVEIINLKSIWQNSWIHSKASFLWTLVIYPFNPQLALVRLFTMPKKELDLWDQLSQKKKTLGFAGSDAEAKIKFFGSPVLGVPSYQTLFSIVKTHVLLQSELTGNYSNDRRKLGEALRRGQFYMSLDVLANPKGFSAYVRNAEGKNFLLGSEINWSEDLELVVSLPDKPLVPFETVIYKDGERVLVSNSQNTQMVLHTPGVYRVVVRVIPTLPIPDVKKWIPWIFSNPFFIR